MTELLYGNARRVDYVAGRQVFESLNLASCSYSSFDNLERYRSKNFVNILGVIFLLFSFCYFNLIRYIIYYTFYYHLKSVVSQTIFIHGTVTFCQPCIYPCNIVAEM